MLDNSTTVPHNPGMNRHERAQLAKIWTRMSRVTRAVILGKVESDTAAHWIEIIGHEIKGMYGTYTIADQLNPPLWWEEEREALKAFLKETPK